DLGAVDGRAARGGGRVHAREVLAAQPRLRAARAEVPDLEPAAGDHRERERGPQDLPAPLAVAAVDGDYPFTHTTCRSSCTTSTRSRCASITLSIGLYAIGVSSITPASLRHSMPSVAWT